MSSSSSPPKKEAVVFILDANPSMNAPYPSTSTSTSGNEQKNQPVTRLDCAKKALVAMISNLMLQTKTNEVSVIVCKTAETQHHKIAGNVDVELEYGDDVPFPNLTELTDGLVRPRVDLLRNITQIQTVQPPELAESLRGDLCDAIILAADCHYEYGRNSTGKTFKRFRRKIVLITDAEHEVVMDTTQVRTGATNLVKIGWRLLAKTSFLRLNHHSLACVDFFTPLTHCTDVDRGGYFAQHGMQPRSHWARICRVHGIRGAAQP